MEDFVEKSCRLNAVLGAIRAYSPGGATVLQIRVFSKSQTVELDISELLRLGFQVKTDGVRWRTTSGTPERMRWL